MVSAEKRSGTAALVLTKPLSRTAFVLAKFVSQTALLAGAVVAGALVTWGVTYAVFNEAPFAPLAKATGVWLVLGIVFVALLELLSAALDSQAGAAGLGFVGFIAISLGTLWRPALDYSPSGLMNAPTSIVMGETGALGWPIAVSLLLTGACVAGAVAVFRRREL
jgi:ABC-2 type transport system permease protein